MGWSNTMAVVLCGGYGFITKSNTPKVVEAINNIPMSRIVFDILRNDMNIYPTLVVTNGHFGEQVRQTLNDNYGLFVEQPKRTGTGNAIELCLPIIPKFESELGEKMRHMLVLYGDMPCWRPSSIAALLQSHIQNEKAVISMFSVNAKKYPSYGRILRDQKNRIIGISEPWQISKKELANAQSANPSAWVFDVVWLKKNIKKLQWHDKKDGFHQEKWLPDLALIAAKQNKTINEIVLKDGNEAMGVNTYQEYLEVLKYLKGRKN